MVNRALKALFALVVAAFVALPAPAVQALTLMSNPLDEIIENMADAESVNFSVDVDVETDNDQLDQPVTVHIDLEGETDFERKSAFDLSFAATDESGNTQTAGGSMIMIGDTLYLSETGGEWHFVELDSAMPTQSDIDDGVEDIQDFMNDLIDRGVISYDSEISERVNGTMTVRYAYEVDMDRLVDSLVDEQQISEDQVDDFRTMLADITIGGNLWIDTSEMLPVKFTMNYSSQPNATSYNTTDITVMFNSFNEAVNISAPEHATNLEDADFSETEDVVTATFESTVASMDTDGDGLTNGKEETIWHTDSFDSDTDDDGYSDYTETRHGYDPNGVGKPDADGDGLSNSEEKYTWKTNPYSGDTDGDGYLDYTEVVNGYNPNGSGKLDTDGDGLTDYAERTIHWTSYRIADTDFDGYADGLEIANGYNPNGPGRW